MENIYINEFHVEEFSIDPYQGAMALASISRPGMELISIDRKDTKVVLIFRKLKGEIKK